MQDPVSQQLAALRQGDADAAEQLTPQLYEQLRALAQRQMGRERAGHTLQPTALAHEAFLRLADGTEVPWADRAHLLGVAAHVLRQILVEHARSRGRQKRGGDRHRVTLQAELLAAAEDRALDTLTLDEALERLAALHERQARVVELRFFGGLDVEEVAEVLGVSPRTVKGDWRLARAWLRRELAAGDER